MKKIINYIKYILFIIIGFFIAKKVLRRIRRDYADVIAIDKDRYILLTIDEKKEKMKRDIKTKSDVKLIKEIKELLNENKNNSNSNDTILY